MIDLIFIGIALICTFIFGFILGIIVLALTANVAQAWLDEQDN